MTTSKKTMRMRAMTVAGGIAIIGATGAGLAGGANAATSSTASSTLAKIKYCESGGNYHAVNSSTGASGAYQFLNSTWKGLSAGKGYATAASAPASVQDAAALELYNEAGTSPWAASSSCWSHLSSAPSTSGTSATSASTASTASTATATTTTSTTSHTAGAAQSSPQSQGAKPAAHGQQKPAPKPIGSVAHKPHATHTGPRPHQMKPAPRHASAQPTKPLSHFAPAA